MRAFNGAAANFDEFRRFPPVAAEERNGDSKVAGLAANQCGLQ
jgi:hypothetical protein